MSFYSINGKNLDTYFNARPSGSYGTDTTGLTNYRINGVDLINYYYKIGDNSGGYNSNLKYTSTGFSSGSTSIDIFTLFQLNLFKSNTNVTYDTIAINNGIIIKITSAPPVISGDNNSSFMEFNFPMNIADILIVGGGGGGGTSSNLNNAGGGGGGKVGVIDWNNNSDKTYNFKRINYIVIGEGGAGDGFSSSLRMIILPSGNTTFVCEGGGRGGDSENGSQNTSGGSSGGSGATSQSSARNTGIGFGNIPKGTVNTYNYIEYFSKRGAPGGFGGLLKDGGGGGGASTSGSLKTGGGGYSWYNSIVVGGGGGGGGQAKGPGGLGGGGDGGSSNSSTRPDPGTANTGGGGGGGYFNNPIISGGAGGTGVIYIRILQSYVVF